MSSAAAQPSAKDVLADASASTWLKVNLLWALERDPQDALNDALALAGILEERLRVTLGLDEPI